MQLFVVGKETGGSWEIMGVFSSKEKAESICLDSSYFVGPMKLDEPAPVETTDWPGLYTPKED